MKVRHIAKGHIAHYAEKFDVEWYLWRLIRELDAAISIDADIARTVDEEFWNLV